MNISDADIVIIGAGFFGATIAERSANAGLRVVIIDKRPHIGGNSYSEIEPKTGIEYHKYGTHIFHTSNQTVVDYVAQFSKFTDYRHHVIACVRGKSYQMPINLGTICQFFEKTYSPSEARALIRSQSNEVSKSEIKNFEDKAISLIGRPLYEAFIRGYTAKQWETDPKLLPDSIISRLPVRFTFNSRYFDDSFEGMPIDGYTRIFEKMLDHENIQILTGVDYFDIQEQISPEQTLIYTGPIDRYFGYNNGRLSWRTVDLENEIVDKPDFQGISVVNYCDQDIPFTRIHEYRHLHPERKYQQESSLIAREYSRFAGKNDEPYYPINTVQDRKTYKQYFELARETNNVIFGGRLGTYRYLDMHQAIAAALKSFEMEVLPRFKGNS